MVLPLKIRSLALYADTIEVQKKSSLSSVVPVHIGKGLHQDRFISLSKLSVRSGVAKIQRGQSPEMTEEERIAFSHLKLAESATEEPVVQEDEDVLPMFEILEKRKRL